MPAMTDIPGPVRKRRWIALTLAVAVGGVLCTLLAIGIDRVRTAASRMKDT